MAGDDDIYRTVAVIRNNKDSLKVYHHTAVILLIFTVLCHFPTVNKTAVLSQKET